ncbi:MAG: hypothetical protein BYD32DRAFT_431256 [Podila humilis]|nr:MAG: hypothetical protein BYD32DRAFT_431256 [Podila humilis]
MALQSHGSQTQVPRVAQHQQQQQVQQQHQQQHQQQQQQQQQQQVQPPMYSSTPKPTTPIGLQMPGSTMSSPSSASSGQGSVSAVVGGGGPRVNTFSSPPLGHPLLSPSISGSPNGFVSTSDLLRKARENAQLGSPTSGVPGGPLSPSIAAAGMHVTSPLGITPPNASVAGGGGGQMHSPNVANGPSAIPPPPQSNYQNRLG